MTETSIPLPIKSSMYSQKNCMISMNIEIRKVTTKGPAKERMLKTYNLLKGSRIYQQR